MHLVSERTMPVSEHVVVGDLFSDVFHKFSRPAGYLLKRPSSLTQFLLAGPTPLPLTILPSSVLCCLISELVSPSSEKIFLEIQHWVSTRGSGLTWTHGVYGFNYAWLHTINHCRRHQIQLKMVPCTWAMVSQEKKKAICHKQVPYLSAHQIAIKA